MTTHHVLPGSLEVDGETVTAGVHTGPSEWVVENLRYVKATWAKSEPVGTLMDLLRQAYDNSEGCLLRGGFKMKEAQDE